MYRYEGVNIGPGNVDLIQRADVAADVESEVRHWSAEALVRDDIYYFSVFADQLDAPIGQILLHDMNRGTGESLVAYHLFAPRWRGRGIGTKALHLLQQFVVSETTLTKLIIITSRDNVASQTIAQKGGFTYVGTPWEDPIHGVVFTWHVQQS
jgi:RimJ/RimL family protein N-acetyltransferase